MKLNYLIVIAAILGAADYFDLFPKKAQTPVPAAAKLDPGKTRSIQAMIRENERAISQLEAQSRRSSRGSMNDTYSLDLRNRKIGELREENSRLEAKLGGQ